MARGAALVAQAPNNASLHAWWKTAEEEFSSRSSPPGGGRRGAACRAAGLRPGWGESGGAAVAGAAFWGTGARAGGGARGLRLVHGWVQLCHEWGNGAAALAAFQRIWEKSLVWVT